MVNLKEATAEKHREAESLPFIRSIFAGEVDRGKYSDYLYQLLLIYDRLEEYANALGLFVGIEEIQRTQLIRQDYAELTMMAERHDVRHNTEKYIDYIDSIHNDSDRLMAHIYVRHMGDMYGGQQLASLVPGSGKMYQFERLAELKTGLRDQLSSVTAEEANLAFDYNIKILKEYSA